MPRPARISRPGPPAAERTASRADGTPPGSGGSGPGGPWACARVLQNSSPAFRPASRGVLEARFGAAARGTESAGRHVARGMLRLPTLPRRGNLRQLQPGGASWRMHAIRTNPDPTDVGAWHEIFEANRDQIRDPDRIQPGQKLRLS